MTKCKICQIDKQPTCICGYCDDCVKKYGHDECAKIEKIKLGVQDEMVDV